MKIKHVTRAKIIFYTASYDFRGNRNPPVFLFNDHTAVLIETESGSSHTTYIAMYVAVVYFALSLIGCYSAFPFHRQDINIEPFHWSFARVRGHWNVISRRAVIHFSLFQLFPHGDPRHWQPPGLTKQPSFRLELASQLAGYSGLPGYS